MKREKERRGKGSSSSGLTDDRPLLIEIREADERSSPLERYSRMPPVPAISLS